MVTHKLSLVPESLCGCQRTIKYLLTFHSTSLLASLKQAAVQRAEQKLLLVDSSKFGVSSLITFCKLTDIDKIITDKRPDEKYIEYCREHSIDLVFPE